MKNKLRNIIITLLTITSILILGKEVRAQELIPKTIIESPNIGSVVNGKIDISGWAINKSGIKEIKIYINDKYIGNAQTGQKRDDIGKGYYMYSDAECSGYVFKYNFDSLPKSKYILKVESIGKDGSQDSVSKNIFVNYLSNKPISFLESPQNEDFYNNKLNLSGWALNSSNIDKVKVYIDWKYVGDANLGYKRQDIGTAYSDQYPNAYESGYSFNYDISKLSIGRHTIMVQPIGKDNTIDNNNRNIRNIYTNFSSLKPTSYLESPGVDNIINDNINISGWALNSSKIKEIKVYIDWKYVGNAKIDILRNDIGQAYLNYPNSYNSGFSLDIPTKYIKSGYHSLMLQPIGCDGTIDNNEKALIRNFNIVKGKPNTTIETPKYGSTVLKSTQISGWAVNYSGIKEIKVYVDGKYNGNAHSGLKREDIGNAFSSYEDSVNSGYIYNLSVNELSKGFHSVEVQVFGFDGTVDVKQLTINSKGVFSYINTGKTLDESVLKQIMYGSPSEYDYSTGTWKAANAEQVKYYMNPDNFVNNDVSELQFLKLTYMDGITVNDVNKILSGKGILNGKGDIFLKASKIYNVNPLYLVSHALLETGNGTSKLSNGVLVKEIHEKFGNQQSNIIDVDDKVTYNIYGIGAYDADALMWGSERAYKENWFSIDAAIIGGAKFISESYINGPEKQDTLYKMRWNSNNIYHQYATDIGWANKQVYNIKRLLDLCENPQVVYEIPVY